MNGSKCAARSEPRDLHVNTAVISGREVRDLNPFNEILVGLGLHLDAAAPPAAAGLSEFTLDIRCAGERKAQRKKET